MHHLLLVRVTGITAGSVAKGGVNVGACQSGHGAWGCLRILQHAVEGWLRWMLAMGVCSCSCCRRAMLRHWRGPCLVVWRSGAGSGWPPYP